MLGMDQFAWDDLTRAERVLARLRERGLLANIDESLA
jgi:hypothetical protein